VLEVCVVCGSVSVHLPRGYDHYVPGADRVLGFLGGDHSLTLGDEQYLLVGMAVSLFLTPAGKYTNADLSCSAPASALINGVILIVPVNIPPVNSSEGARLDLTTFIESREDM
jgi:hypothetical protein